MPDLPQPRQGLNVYGEPDRQGEALTFPSFSSHKGQKLGYTMQMFFDAVDPVAVTVIVF